MAFHLINSTPLCYSRIKINNTIKINIYKSPNKPRDIIKTLTTYLGLQLTNMIQKPTLYSTKLRDNLLNQRAPLYYLILL